jgi:alpha-N-arabinofuranosidase
MTGALGETRMARITVDLDRQLGRVDRRIFGGFIEHLGRCIYGGIFDEGSTLADARGFRTDVLDALRPLKMPLLRWPGGNFVSGYHWVDGIGPRDERPRKLELAWLSEESNRFGTDEFIEYCRELNTDPFICINMGTGTIDEAQAWVEYCNGTSNTYWANLRRKNGHEEPYNVRYWGLGNELYGGWQLGQMAAEDYVKRAREYAKVMKLTDPSIELISCGQNGWDDWDRVVIDGLAQIVDYHSIHIYTGHDDYYRNVFEPHQAERAIRVCSAFIEQARYTQRIARPIGIAYDEWNIWYRTRTPEGRKGGIEEQYDLSDALAVATYLNIFIRECERVPIANLAQMVNVIAPIFTRPDGLFFQTIYHPLRLYAEYAHDIALDPTVVCDTHTLPSDADFGPRAQRVADLGPFKLLDVSATRDEAGRAITLGIVNRHQSDAISTTIEIGGDASISSATAYEVNGEDVTVRNSFDRPDAVVVHERQLAADGASIEITLPAHSVTVVRLAL